ncbi:immunity-related GTPase family M protein 1-like [Choloepus didactylus]|uniref:immunity-related GTPase family M protein 1-like n=1 Tax=Choloepus didactylus TaxID=27675 RepID=UPI0018A12091|nr:immunity-related GTPase family M protein 1-like [Choloepus didactylus]
MEESLPPSHTPLSASSNSLPPDSSWIILDEAEFIRNENDWSGGKLLEVVPKAREALRTVSCTPVNIAVMGDAGNGMSSFINALRGIGHEEEAAAPIGVVRTTLTRASYSSSHFPNVLLWDLPGIGSTTQSLENYLREMQLNQYDLFIIIASEQFSMNHVWLAKTIEGMGKKFYIVWTKLDRDLSTRTLYQEDLQQNIRGTILKNLQEEQVCVPLIFLVSNLDPSLHDFPKLRDTLQKDVTKLRCHGPLQKLFQTYEKSINHKVTSLQEKIDTQSFQDVLGIRNADDLEECLKAYHRHFGVDDESLQRVAQITGTDFPHYKDLMKSQDLQAVNQGSWNLPFMNCTVVQAFPNLLSYIPFLGNYFIHYLRGMKQKYFLSVVAEDTKTILSEVLKFIPHESQLGSIPKGPFSSGRQDT